MAADEKPNESHAEVKTRLQTQPRFHTHFTPTSPSWQNLVQRFLRDAPERITTGSSASVKELANAITTFLAGRNGNPKRLVWRAKGKEIRRKVQGAREAISAPKTAASSA